MRLAVPSVTAGRLAWLRTMPYHVSLSTEHRVCRWSTLKVEILQANSVCGSHVDLRETLLSVNLE